MAISDRIIAQLIKDPNAILDYGFDWSEWLQTDETISTSTWTVPTGVTQASTQRTDTQTKIFLSGGTVGQTYRITNRIVTNQTRQDDRSILIKIIER